MATETESKFLVTSGWRKAAGFGLPYIQGYLSTDPKRTVRVRVAGTDAFLTIKGEKKSASGDEYEYPIPHEDALNMLDFLCVKPVISKTRYIVQHDNTPHGTLKFEIDEFHGENEGLVIAEVEYPEGTMWGVPKEALPLPKGQKIKPYPEWLSTDVTGMKRYYNSSLIAHPFKDWDVRLRAVHAKMDDIAAGKQREIGLDDWYEVLKSKL